VEAGEHTVTRHAWGLGVMIGVLGVNLALALWQGRWARRLNSDILHADAHHTMADVLTTVVVIGGWQFAARGYSWLDTVLTIGMAGFVLILVYRLFKRVVPILVDRIAAEPEMLADVVRAVPGVRRVHRIRSQWIGTFPTVDVVITVAPELSTVEAHSIADTIEALLRKRYSMEDVTVHIEPGS
jgi:cation diffusion facilitator family transporter